MWLKGRLMELLKRGAEQEVAELVVSERRAIRPLLSRLWDPEEGIRRRAARALGLAARAHSELGVEIIRRLLWALNDESGTNGVNALAGLGEIGRQSPELLGPYLPMLVSLVEDEGLRNPLLRALTAVAEEAPGLVEPHVEALSRAFDRERGADSESLESLMAAVRRTHEG